MDADPESDPREVPIPRSPLPTLTASCVFLALCLPSSPSLAQPVAVDRSIDAAGLLPLEAAEPPNPHSDFVGPPAKDFPPPPFGAWANAPSYVRKEPKVSAHLSGVLQRGDTVNVTACVPDCKSPRAWAILGNDGAVPLRILRQLPVPMEAFGSSAAVRYEYGRVPNAETPVFAAPQPKSKVIRKEKAEFRLAFVPNPEKAKEGWLQRPDGGWMRAKDIKLFTPSKFEGVRGGFQGDFVYLRRKAVLKPPPAPGQKAQKPTPEETLARTLHRYDHLPLLGEKAGRVLVPGGSLPRGLVRIVRHVPRPKGIAAEDHWLHVDLREQVLTAYQGDERVMATLVSTGKSDRQSTKTPVGTFKIYGKSVHASMRGKPWDDYYAEEVPYPMHYDDGRALHGAYWHDQFGVEKSHGCINLSPADAAWLFAWVPPRLPDGWHSILAVSARLPTAWVVVEDPGENARKKRVRPSELADAGVATRR